MTINFALTIETRAIYCTEQEWSEGDIADDSQTLEPGETVEYQGHVVGGMVKALRNGQIIYLHPACTKELK